MKTTWPMVSLLALAAAPASASPVLARVEVPLAAEAVAERPINSSLRLHVRNYGESIDIEVISRKPVPGCFENLAHRRPHGPDPSEVMAWQVTAHYYEAPRLIRLCRRPYIVKVDLVAPKVSEDGRRFASGSVVVTVLPDKRAPRRGT